MQTLDQKRAKHAWDHVNVHGGKLESNKVKRIPTRILNSGLAPTIAYMKAKQTDEPFVVIQAIEEWVNQHIPLKRGESSDLFERILAGNSEFLRRVTDEAMAYLQWYVRFVEAKAKAS